MKSTIFHIQGNDSIQSVQHRFGALFPSMQISFFKDPDISKKSDQCILFSENVKINEINRGVRDLTIEITPDMRVIDLENKIKLRGLHAEISCRIKDRLSSDSSVCNWLLNDVYDVDNPLSVNTTNNRMSLDNHKIGFYY
jgi:hypothetical protein